MVESLHPSFERLMTRAPAVGVAPPIGIPRSGVYLFSEGDRHLYVGRSNRLRERYFLHCRSGSQQNQASFAFKLAREATNRTTATYQQKGGRKDLMLDRDFMEAFQNAKGRIRQMQYRYVEETDQTRQALLEVYVSIALDTPYNDFNTH